MYQPVPPYTDPVPPSTNQYRTWMDSPWTAKNWECCLGITDFCTVYPRSCLDSHQIAVLASVLGSILDINISFSISIGISIVLVLVFLLVLVSERDKVRHRGIGNESRARAL